MTITADKKSEETKDERALRLKAMGSDELLTESKKAVTDLANLITCSEIGRSWNSNQFKPCIDAKSALVSALFQEIRSRMVGGGT